TFDPVSGIFSGTPTIPGTFTFTVEASDTTEALVSKTYVVTIAGAVNPVTSTIATSADPAIGGFTTGAGVYNNGNNVTVTATANPGFSFVNWTEGGITVSASTSYTFAANGNRSLVANFASAYVIETSSNPSAGGTTDGAGSYNAGSVATVTATANPGFAFVNWTERAAMVSDLASYKFQVNGNRSLVANFADIEKPVIHDCPSDVTVGNDAGACGAKVSWIEPTATDNVAVTSLSSNHKPGDNFPVGTTVVTYTARDAAGNTSTCSFNVKVQDTQKPVINGASANPAVLWPVNRNMVPVTINYTASDNCAVTS